MKSILSRKYFAWKLYHILFTDPGSILSIVRDPYVYKLFNKSYGMVLDIGSGPGNYLKKFSRRSGSVFSSDLNFSSLERLSKRLQNIPNVSFTCFDGCQMPFKLNEFNLVLAMEILEHLAEDRKAISTIASILKPDGLLLITVPLKSYFRTPIHDPDIYGHKRSGYDEVELKAMLSAEKLIILDKRYFFYGLSQTAFKFVTIFKRILGFFPPSIFILPLFLERFFPTLISRFSKPANILIVAKKAS
jgi:SAM-dependent methyltransferase